MGEKILVNIGGILPTPCNFRICRCLDTKFGTVIEFCIFYPKTKKLGLLIYANEFITSSFCSRALKGIEIQTTVKSSFSNLLS